MQQLSDIECVMQVVGGDTNAFGMLVERYSERVYALVAGIVGPGAEAEDLVQEIFIKAWGNLHKFACRSSFATWLYRIAYNAAISTRRARKRELQMVTPAKGLDLPDEVEQQQFTDVDIEQLERAVELLPPRQRAIIELHYRQDLSLAEVAEVVESNENNVKVMIHRARRQLAALIKQNRYE